MEESISIPRLSVPVVRLDSYGDPIVKNLHLLDWESLKYLISGLELYNHVFKIVRHHSKPSYALAAASVYKLVTILDEENHPFLMNFMVHYQFVSEVLRMHR